MSHLTGREEAIARIQFSYRRFSVGEALRGSTWFRRCKEEKETESEKNVKPVDSQASLCMSGSKSKAEAVIVQTKKQEPSKPPQKSEVAVKVSFVKHKGNEACYVAIVRMRSMPLVLLLGNIVVLIILLIGSYFGFFLQLYFGPEYPTTTKGLRLVYRGICCGIAGFTLYYALNHNVESCYGMFEFVREPWIHEPSGKYQSVVLGAEKYLIEETCEILFRVQAFYHMEAQH